MAFMYISFFLTINHSYIFTIKINSSMPQQRTISFLVQLELNVKKNVKRMLPKQLLSLIQYGPEMLKFSFEVPILKSQKCHFQL